MQTVKLLTKIMKTPLRTLTASTTACKSSGDETLERLSSTSRGSPAGISSGPVIYTSGTSWKYFVCLSSQGFCDLASFLKEEEGKRRERRESKRGLI
ncbi:hypothetical protein E2C01_067537 [Portunus trituberculatus]|uniref:Uncharacterized protein n=1 Tax=Portunus trituberculatus TaxID=210409 RepID=A0A5B7HTW0_PORTR|nr:hypothetical protein [Portunus trituberculatus]